MKSIVATVIAALCLVHASAGEVLIHSGPTVSTPDATAYSPQPDSEKNGKDLTFLYEFFVDAKILEKLPAETSQENALPAIKAIEVASKSAEVEERDTAFPVRKLELLTYGTGLRKISYYLIALRIDMSAETHRVVLMDGTVIKPKLRKLDK